VTAAAAQPDFIHRLLITETRRFGSQFCFRLQVREMKLWSLCNAKNYTFGPPA